MGQGVSLLPKPEGPRVAREKSTPQHLCPGVPFSDLGALTLGLLSLPFTPTPHSPPSKGEVGLPGWLLTCPFFPSRVKLVPKDPEALKVPRVCVVNPAPLALLVLLALL